MGLYTYQHEYSIGNIKIIQVFGIKQSKISEIIRKIFNIFEWFSIGVLFYLNNIYIHSKLFSIFIFIIGLYLMFTLGIKTKVCNKKEFLEKVDEVLKK